MTPDNLKALRAVRDGGEVQRHQIDWLKKWHLIDRNSKLTVKGTEALTDYEEKNTGD